MNTRKTRAMRRGGRSQRPRAATERGGTREAATHAGRVGGGTYALGDHARSPHAKTVTPAGTWNTGLHRGLSRKDFRHFKNRSRSAPKMHEQTLCLVRKGCRKKDVKPRSR